MNRTRVPKDDDSHSEQETARRRDEWLRRSLKTPPKHHSDMIAERRGKGGKSKPERPK
jgi:hypothetical protein